MRYLLLTRGMPLCGKTTWIKQHHLESYVLSAKLFKDLTRSVVLDDLGNLTHAKHNEKLAYSMLLTALQERMERGDFIIIEDNHIAKAYCSNYKEMAREYAYKVVMVDFSDVAFETICARNEIATKHAPHNAYSKEDLHEFYTMLCHSELPIKCQTITPDSISSLLYATPHNLSNYKVIHHIGDIHGSYNVLQQYIGTMKNDEFYIFLGDYIDRGQQNHEVLSFLLKIMDKKNVCLLEGNHEKWLWDWANDREVSGREFRLNTQVELEQKGFQKHDAKRLYMKFLPYFFYRFHEKQVLCTHGGLSNIPKHLPLLQASQSIHGVGSYLNANNIANAFTQNTEKNTYQVFGHRNKTGLPLCLFERNFILESQVEFGGHLRTLQLTKQGFKDSSVQNKHFVIKEEKEAKRKLQRFYDSLQSNTQFCLKKNDHFVGILYPKKIANLAYTFDGCIVDTKRWEIVGRGYELSCDKREFFKPHKHTILKHVVFPLHVTRKIQGKQVLLAYYHERFYVFKDFLLQNELPEFLQDETKLKELSLYLGNGTHSLLCVESMEGEFYLTSVFANEAQISPFSHEKQKYIAHLLGIKTQDILWTLENKEQYISFIENLNAHNLTLSKELARESLPASDNNEKNMLTLFALEQAKQQDEETRDLSKNETCSFLCGFYVRDCAGNFFEVPTMYDYEIRVLVQCAKIWQFHKTITTLQVLHNPFRKAFFHWCSGLGERAFSMPIVWIINGFLHVIMAKKTEKNPVYIEELHTSLQYCECRFSLSL